MFRAPVKVTATREDAKTQVISIQDQLDQLLYLKDP